MRYHALLEIFKNLDLTLLKFRTMFPEERKYPVGIMDTFFVISIYLIANH
jgi:peptidoglycan/LPS O-acetylase OafA/YrhL